MSDPTCKFCNDVMPSEVHNAANRDGFCEWECQVNALKKDLQKSWAGHHLTQQALDAARGRAEGMVTALQAGNDRIVELSLQVNDLVLAGWGGQPHMTAVKEKP